MDANESAKAVAYPIQDPYLATVIGTPPELQADLGKPPKLKLGKWIRFPQRDVPNVFMNGNTLRYIWARQKEPAPLVFVLAGTGGSFFDPKVRFLMSALHHVGFHVVGLSSPTHTSFITSASESEMPGRPRADAEDLIAVMRQVRGDLEKKIEITGFGLVGYSLGGTDAAFVAELDSRNQEFDFFEVYLINPAVNLHRSALKLDELYREALPDGDQSINRLVSTSLEKAIHYVHQSGSTPLGSEFLYQAIADMHPTDADLEGVIATSFRLSSANMSFTADAMTRSGKIVDPTKTLKIGTEMEGYFNESLQWSFVRYLDELLLPYWVERTDLNREQLVAQASLASIRDFLRNTEFIEVVTNQDDIVLGPEDLEFLTQTFGDRAVIHPHGGHCGNLEFDPNVRRMQERFVSAAQGRGERQ
ncbi:alpha/beta fold hydrolase [Myxococcota bacterium]|nr:alpha/beta fold hydrolase [Myxococcota bacterium]